MHETQEMCFWAISQQNNPQARGYCSKFVLTNNHGTVHNLCFPQFILDSVGAKGAESQGQHPNLVKITNTNASC